jgi:ATP-binding cassette subfamily B protein
MLGRLNRKSKKGHIVGQTKLPKTFGKFIFHFLKKYKLSVFLMTLGPLWWGVDNVLSSYFVRLIINDVATSNLSFSETFSRFTMILVGFMVLPLILSFMWRMYSFAELRLAKMAKDINLEVLDYTENHSYEYFQNNMAGSIGNKINDIVSNTFQIINLVMQSFLGGVFNILITSAAMYYIHPLLSLVVFVWSLFFLYCSFLFSKKGQKYSQDFSEEKSKLTGKIVDSVSNIMSIKLFGRNEYELNYIGKQSEKVVQKNRKFLWFRLIDFSVKDIFLFTFISSLLLTLIYLKSKNLITPGDFAFVFTANFSVIFSVWHISMDITNYMQFKGTVDQALSIITQKQSILDKEDAKPIDIKTGKIEFKNVSFRYSSKAKVFNDLNLFIPGGQRVGLVGFSGSGKSTLTKLILRYFDIQKGKILIDNQDITDVQQCSLRDSVATIPQEPTLFHRSIMDNIRYGKLDASDYEVIEAAKKAKCHEFIIELEDGYDTFVGERGVKLSGGQRQRVAIARAILKNAPILIFDEATSALDSVTEQFIQNNLEQITKGKTTIAIAHRLSTLLKMDRILVFDKGGIVEDGSHRQLLKKNGRYRELWSMQSDGFLPDNE